MEGNFIPVALQSQRESGCVPTQDIIVVSFHSEPNLKFVLAWFALLLLKSTVRKTVE